MPNLICGAPQQPAHLTRRVVVAQLAATGARLTRRVIAGLSSGAITRRRMALNFYAAPQLARPAGARRVSGVIVPRAFAGARFAAGVLIPRRARVATQSGTPRFLRLQSGGVLRLQSGDKLQLRQNDNG